MDEPIVRGPKGEIAHRDLVRHGEQFAPRLWQITDRVWQLVGVRSIANCAMIKGDTGLILVDSGSSIDDAEAFIAASREITDGPIVAVIYTHSHYTRGARAYLDAMAPEPVAVWGHAKVHENYTRGRPEIFPTYVRKIATQMGNLCPAEGEDAPPNAGLGGEYHTSAGRYGYVEPTHTVGTETDVTIDGVRFRLIPAISDTDDCLTIWLPDERVVIENIFWRVYPNFGAIRGEFYRRPTLWADSVDAIRKLKPEHILGCHGIPYSGAETIDAMLADYRDGIQYLYDQTIRGINRGLDQRELAEAVHLPNSLKSNPVMQEFYGEFEFGVRGVYNGVMGWFGTDTATLHPVPKRVEAERIIAGYGGREAMRAEADRWFDEGDYSWSAQLAGYLVTLDPDNADDRQRKARALRELGRRSRSSITRNYYLVEARELEGRVDSFSVPHRSYAKLIDGGPEMALEMLRYEVDPVRAAGLSCACDIAFPDRDRRLRLDLRNCVLLVDPAPAGRSGSTLEISFDDFAKLLCNEASLRDLLSRGEAVINGPDEPVMQLLACFDTALTA